MIYVTARLPYGVGEPFIIAEVAELARQGSDVAVVPVRPKGGIVHRDAAGLVPNAISSGLLSGAVLGSALIQTARAPAAAMRALLLLRESRSVRIFLKNLAVVPKSLWLARRARRLGVAHLHAHWGGTSATVALLASEVSGIPWSFTAHRWDITENNLLPLKARRACFVRVISERGGNELRDLVGRPDWSPWLLHMGVQVPPLPRRSPPDAPSLRILVAASFREVKGHIHLIEAVGRLRERDVPVHADLAGDGPLEWSLRARVVALGLDDEITFLGRVSHDDLLSEMQKGKWDVAVLPSVVARSGAQEGIPVSLIEAMAYGLPTIGTESGGIPELLGDGHGLLVAPADPEALAAALERVAGDPALRATLAERGRKRVEESFSVTQIASALHSRFRECGKAVS